MNAPTFVPSVRLSNALEAMARANASLAEQTARFKLANDSLSDFLRREGKFALVPRRNWK